MGRRCSSTQERGRGGVNYTLIAFIEAVEANGIRERGLILNPAVNGLLSTSIHVNSATSPMTIVGWYVL